MADCELLELPRICRPIERLWSCVRTGSERAGRAHHGGDGQRDGECQCQRVRVGRHSGEDGYQ